jgi:hypothetical protein
MGMAYPAIPLLLLVEGIQLGNIAVIRLLVFAIQEPVVKRGI